MIAKKILFSLLIFLFSFVLTLPVHAKDSPKSIYLFYGEGCPHCSAVEQYFDEEKLYDIYPVEKKEIYFDRENALLFNTIMDSLGIPPERRGVPTAIIGNQVLVGDTPIIEEFKTSADTFLAEDSLQKAGDEGAVTLPSGLTLFAVIIGALVDAINPCEFAVLIILMSTILATGNPRKALYTGLAFSASIFISYFLMGLGLYKALGFGILSPWFFYVIGGFAILLGLFNLKDYFWYGKGFLMEVPLSWRPRLKSIIHSVTNPGGAFAIGFVVSLFLLPCTSGPYIVILGMLAKNALSIQAILYLVLYNLLFVSPMILISFAVYKGFDPNKAEEIRQKRLRTLHLITGIIMLIMGIVILGGWL